MLLKEPQLPRQPAGCGCLEQDGHKNGEEGDRGDDLRAWRPHTEENAGERAGDHTGLPGPAHEDDLFKAPFGASVGTRAKENR